MARKRSWDETSRAMDRAEKKGDTHKSKKLFKEYSKNYKYGQMSPAPGGGWQKGPRGGMYKIVNGKKVYK